MFDGMVALSFSLVVQRGSSISRGVIGFCKGFFHLVNNGNEDTHLLSFTVSIFSFFLHF